MCEHKVHGEYRKENKCSNETKGCINLSWSSHHPPKKIFQHIFVKGLKNSKSLMPSTSPVKKNMTRSGIVSWMLSSMTFVMAASRSTMSAFCMITFKQFLLTLGRERKKSSNFFLPTSRKFGKPAGTRKQGSASGGKKQNRGETLFEKNIGNLFRFHPFQCFKKIF